MFLLLNHLDMTSTGYGQQGRRAVTFVGLERPGGVAGGWRVAGGSLVACLLLQCCCLLAPWRGRLAAGGSRGGASLEGLTGDLGRRAAGCGSDTTRDRDGAMGRRAAGQGDRRRRRRVGLTFPSRLGVSCRGSFYWANGPEKWG